MAPSFGRSISFPLSPARSSSKPRAAAARHVRSISLPSSRAHPLLAHLQNTTRAWATSGEPTSPSSGLAHLDALHAALAELLLLPEARAALQHGSATADCLLDAFLALADAHGAFQEALLDLRRHAADARAALRRHDAARLASAARAQRSAEKDIARLASSVRAAGAKFVPHLLAAGSSAAASVAEVEVSGVLAEAVAAIASASSAVFSAVESISSAATTAAASSSKKPATLISMVTRSKASASSDEDREMAALDKLENLDECIATMEAGSDKAFRSILQTRVALLNIHTQTC
ncbi:unnamed protein product [Urochloa decumbens]|uniref:Uncharacterized protein n=1 Tax=Urochloa decumbens TaxID=240449 RepID=A0ABC9DL85_9POAL